MPQKIKDVQPPTGLSRFLFRLPIWLYRAKLGWLLGGRFLLLKHIGRKSGLPRQAVLEIVRHDKKNDTYIVCAGFGPKTQWYQNLVKRPEATIQVGRRKLEVVAERLSPAEGGEEMVSYAQRHPTAASNVHLLGYSVDGSEEDYRALGELLRYVALRPRPGKSRPADTPAALEIVADYAAALTRGDSERMNELHSPDFVLDIVSSDAFEDDPLSVEETKEFWPSWFAGFSQMDYEVTRTIAAKEVVVTQWTFTGVNTGTLEPPVFGRRVEPLGKTVHFRGVSIYDIGQGLIQRETLYMDLATLWVELGVEL